jgi:catechol 2,3-dioxygenase-like lactoylglutathione lyase family enzyme
MVDHVGLAVSDFARSRRFHEQALTPLGVRLMMEPAEGVAGFGRDRPFLWLDGRGGDGAPGAARTRVAILAGSRAEVDAFHAAALAAGAVDNGPPATDLPRELLRRLRARPGR